MLPRPLRLSSSREIRQIVRGGRCAGTPALRLCLAPRLAPPSRVAVVVGSRVSRSAVVRHRWQRRLRAQARALLAEAAREGSYDMVWIAQPGIEALLTAADVRQEMVVLMRRLRLV